METIKYYADLINNKIAIHYFIDNKHIIVINKKRVYAWKQKHSNT